MRAGGRAFAGLTQGQVKHCLDPGIRWCLVLGVVPVRDAGKPVVLVEVPGAKGRFCKGMRAVLRHGAWSSAWTS